MRATHIIAAACLTGLALNAAIATAADLPFIEVDPASKTAFREHGRHRPFVAVGLNYFDHETGWAPHLWQKFDEGRVREQLRMIGERGFNTIRVFITLQSFEQEAGQVTPEGEAKFRKMLDLCRINGIRVIPTGPELWEGAPAWYKGDRFTDEALLAAEESWWKQFAAKFADAPSILAWDLANEPAVAWDSPSMRVGWNNWLKGKYGSAEKLAVAWKVPTDKVEAFGNVSPPPNTPARGDSKLLDYQRFREHVGDAWTARMSAAIRSVDRYHMVTVGHIQWASPVMLPSVWHYAGFNFRDNARHVDFTTIHFYPLDWPKPCDKPEGLLVNRVYLQALLHDCAVGKPVMLGEFNWYGGGGLKGTSGWDLPEKPIGHQVEWCNELLDVSRGRVCGWLNWAFADTVTARDISRWSGCWTSDLKLKPWGKVFGDFSRAVQLRPPVPRRFDPPFAENRLDRDAALTDPAVGNAYRQSLLAATTRPH
jgi:hypothetical protein